MALVCDWVAVDWGTSNMRLWGIGGDGEIVFSESSDQGMGRLTPDEYEPHLLTLLERNGIAKDASLDVLVCGMAGARQGWREAGYKMVPCPLSELATGSVFPNVQSRLKVRILPGLASDAAGAEDVMRGEETQLLGLDRIEAGYRGLVCMPGTHSKWARLDSGTVVSFNTAMTGEMFDILKTHSVLRHSVSDEEAGQSEGFVQGAQLGLDQPERLTSALFATRARTLLANTAPGWGAGYLSGLLIGAEIGARRDEIADADIVLIGSGRLCALYAQVVGLAGGRSRTIDATQATLAGLFAAREMIA